MAYKMKPWARTIYKKWKCYKPYLSRATKVTRTCKENGQQESAEESWKL